MGVLLLRPELSLLNRFAFAATRFRYRWTILSPEAPAIRLAVASKAASNFSRAVRSASDRAPSPTHQFHHPQRTLLAKCTRVLKKEAAGPDAQQHLEQHLSRSSLTIIGASRGLEGRKTVKLELPRAVSSFWTGEDVNWPKRKMILAFLYPTPDLPDDTPLEHVRFSTRIRNALEAGGLRTVGQVRAATNVELLNFQDLDPGSVRHLREVLGARKK